VISQNEVSIFPHLARRQNESSSFSKDLLLSEKKALHIRQIVENES